MGLSVLSLCRGPPPPRVRTDLTFAGLLNMLVQGSRTCNYQFQCPPMYYIIYSHMLHKIWARWKKAAYWTVCSISVFLIGGVGVMAGRLDGKKSAFALQISEGGAPPTCCSLSHQDRCSLDCRRQILYARQNCVLAQEALA
jgi:hypothetical protein